MQGESYLRASCCGLCLFLRMAVLRALCWSLCQLCHDLFRVAAVRARLLVHEIFHRRAHDDVHSRVYFHSRCERMCASESARKETTASTKDVLAVPRTELDDVKVTTGGEGEKAAAHVSHH